MLSPFDDYPIHQTSLPLAQAGGGHPDHYDRFWFNGYSEDLYFGIALGTYPNRGVIDAAIGVVRDGVQRSLFSSGPLPLDRTHTSVGPITVEIIEPMRVAQVTIAENEHGVSGTLTFRTRTAALEEPRQTRWNADRLSMDVTRATQLGDWSGTLVIDGETIDLGLREIRGTKDRSWGIRPVGDPAPMAPPMTVANDADRLAALPQLFFLWAPINFDDTALHYMVFEDRHGTAWSKTAAALPVIDSDGAVVGQGAPIVHLGDVRHHLGFAEGLRRSESASLEVVETGDVITLEPMFAFHMRGAGYLHPTWGHGRWHGGPAVGGEVHRSEELDTLDFHNIHVQQVVRATWGDRVGLGVLEQLIIGPHTPSGFTDLLDGAR
ncbi:MAG: hypothetical protein WCI12_01220 [Actinomycetes bacterium]